MRRLSSALAFVYLVTQGFFPHRVEASFWAERRQVVERQRGASVQTTALSLSTPALLAGNLPPLEKTPLTALANNVAQSLPEKFKALNGDLLSALPLTSGTVRKVSLPKNPSGLTVVHIQDVHMNLEAQKNIAQAVQSLAGTVGLVALEGSHETMDLSKFRTFPHHDAVKMVADYLLKEGKISGPVHTAFTGPAQMPPVVGVEDGSLYDANVTAYRQAAPDQEKRRAQLADVQKDLNQRKETVFNPALKKLDKADSLVKSLIFWGQINQPAV